MNIGQAAAQSGLPPKTIRYYESVGLVVPRRQADNRYRAYSAADVQHLRFLCRARQAGFSLAQSRELLALYRDSSRPGAHQDAGMKALVMAHVEQLEEQLHTLADMRDTLLDMAQRCANDEPDEGAATKAPTQAGATGMSFT